MNETAKRIAHLRETIAGNRKAIASLEEEIRAAEREIFRLEGRPTSEDVETVMAHFFNHPPAPPKRKR